MTMNTIFILVKDGELKEVAPSFNPDDALRHFTWASQGGNTGEMYAVRCSDSVAVQLRTMASEVPKRKAALQLAKSLAYSLTKCADIT